MCDLALGTRTHGSCTLYPVLHLAYASGEYHIPLWEYRVQSTGRTSYQALDKLAPSSNRGTRDQVHLRVRILAHKKDSNWCQTITNRDSVLKDSSPTHHKDVWKGGGWGLKRRTLKHCQRPALLVRAQRYRQGEDAWAQRHAKPVTPLGSRTTRHKTNLIYLFYSG